MFGEVFTHRDLDGVTRHFSVQLLRESIAADRSRWRLTSLPISRADATFIMQNHGIEKARVAALPLSVLAQPGIACLFPDGSTLIVDGNHRLVKRVRRGENSMEFWIAEEDVWRDCLVSPANAVAIGET